MSIFRPKPKIIMYWWYYLSGVVWQIQVYYHYHLPRPPPPTMRYCGHVLWMGACWGGAAANTTTHAQGTWAEHTLLISITWPSRLTRGLGTCDKSDWGWRQGLVVRGCGQTPDWGWRQGLVVRGCSQTPNTDTLNRYPLPTHHSEPWCRPTHLVRGCWKGQDRPPKHWQKAVCMQEKYG